MALKITKILISQPKPTEKSPYYDIAEKYNLQIDFRPFIKVEPISTTAFMSQKIQIQEYTAIIFTAKIAIDHYFHLCKELRIQISESLKFFCLTESTAIYLHKYITYRKRKIFFPKSSKLSDLAICVSEHRNENFLIPVSDIHGETLLRLLDEQSIFYRKAVMYRTVSNDLIKEKPFDYDLVLFFSPSGIASLLKNFPAFRQDNLIIGTFGPSTAKAAENAGLRLSIKAPSPKIPSMITALENYLEKQHLKTKTYLHTVKNGDMFCK